MAWDREDDEAMQLRESIRAHWSALASHSKDPLNGISWGPDFDEYSARLDALARQSGLTDVPALPWTSRTLFAVDERCRAAELIAGPSLLPEAT